MIIILAVILPLMLGLADSAYYVAPGLAQCPKNEECHILSYYINKSSNYFTSNTTFVFVEGEHLLEMEGLTQVAINNVFNITLRGVVGSRSSLQPSAIIKCGVSTRGLSFDWSRPIFIENIAITDCGNNTMPPLQISNSLRVSAIELLIMDSFNGMAVSFSGMLLIQDSHFSNISNNAIYMENVCNVTITSSYFTTSKRGIEMYNNVNNMRFCPDNNIQISNTIDNCSFKNNYDIAVFINTNQPALTVHQSTFNDNGEFNSSTLKAALFVTGGQSTVFHTIGCAFLNNVNRAVYVSSGEMIMQDCTFHSNTVAVFDIFFGGAGVALFGNSIVSISDSSFTNNTVVGDVQTAGGAIRMLFPQICHHVTLSNLSIVNNMADNGGGAVIESQSCNCNNITITDIVFRGNMAFNGGSLILFSESTLSHDILIRDTKFIENHASNFGGGAKINLFGDENVKLAIDSIVCNQNTAGFGGGLLIRALSTQPLVAISNSTFTDNSVNFYGGGIDWFTDVGFGSVVSIDNCTFANNAADFGGGLHAYLLATRGGTCQVQVSRTLFLHNSGSAISLTSCHTIFINGHSTIANNTTPLNGGGVYLDGHSYIDTDSGGSVTFSGNIAEGFGGAIFSADGDISRGEIYIEPAFFSPCSVADNISATFIDNNGIIAGDNIYGGTFFNCNNLAENSADSILFVSDTFDNVLDCPNIPQSSRYSSVHFLSPVSSDPLAVCTCDDIRLGY